MSAAVNFPSPDGRGLLGAGGGNRATGGRL
jgi:hypothetical protein